MILTNEKILKLYNLSSLHRYNNRHTIKEESVATHSFYVSLFVELISPRLLANYDGNKDKVTLLAFRYATLHDLPEIETSDVPWSTKQLDKIFAKRLDFIDTKVMADLLPGDSYKTYSKIKQATSSVFAEEYRLARLIVDIADVLSVYQFALLEKSLGNTLMEKIINDTMIRLDELNQQSFDEFGHTIFIEGSITKCQETTT